MCNHVIQMGWNRILSDSAEHARAPCCLFHCGFLLSSAAFVAYGTLSNSCVEIVSFLLDVLVILQAGDNCEQCESGCTKPRPEGCTHSCLKPCHPGDCPPCSQMLRVQCHCSLNQLYIQCSDWTSSNEDKKQMLQSCGNQCPKNVSSMNKISMQIMKSNIAKCCVQKLKSNFPFTQQC